jgi:hypothetical protein
VEAKILKDFEYPKTSSLGMIKNLINIF